MSSLDFIQKIKICNYSFKKWRSRYSWKIEIIYFIKFSIKIYMTLCIFFFLITEDGGYTARCCRLLEYQHTYCLTSRPSCSLITSVGTVGSRHCCQSIYCGYHSACCCRHSADNSRCTTEPAVDVFWSFCRLST